MKIIKRFCCLIALLFFILCSSSCNVVSKIKPGDFGEYTDRLFATIIGNDELTIHYLFKDKEALGIKETSLSLPTPGSSSALGRLIINLYFGPMANYNYDELDFDQKMTYNVILNLLDRINEKVGDMVYLDNNYLGSYLGYQAQLPILFAEYRFDCLDDVYNYFGLLELVPETFEEYYNYEVKKSEAGYGMPDFVIDKVIDQCHEFIASGENHFLITTFPSRLDTLNLPDEQRAELIEQNKSKVLNDVCSGYRYIEENLGNLKGQATNNLGLYHYRHLQDDGTYYELGQEYYKYLFKQATGYEDDMEEAIAYMQNHLDQLVAEIRSLQAEDEEIKEKAAAVVLMDDTPAEQMEYYKTLLPGHFPVIEHWPTINIKDVDPSMEDHFSPAAYISSAIDDYSQESIFLNQKKINGDYNYLYTTLGHEGIPGHMYQNIYFKTQDVNKIRKVLKSSGYQEGWATYVELYMYNFVTGVDENVISYLKDYDILNGVLTARLDMGIHYEGWDQAQTKEYLERYFGSYTDERIQKIYEQLVEVPTNSQTYFYTYFKIQDMYDRTKLALGESFDPTEFHQVILDCGPVPLRFVEVVVDEYISSKVGNNA